MGEGERSVWKSGSNTVELSRRRDALYYVHHYHALVPTLPPPTLGILSPLPLLAQATQTFRMTIESPTGISPCCYFAIAIIHAHCCRPGSASATANVPKNKVKQVFTPLAEVNE